MHLRALISFLVYISLTTLTQWPISTGVTIDCYIPMESVIDSNFLQLALSIRIGSFTVVGSMMLLFMLEHLTDGIGNSFLHVFLLSSEALCAQWENGWNQPILLLCHTPKLKSSSFFFCTVFQLLCITWNGFNAWSL